MYKISPATAAKRDLRLMLNAMPAKMAASSIAEAPIPHIFTPAHAIATTNEVMPATTSAAHIPPVMAFSAPVTSETSSQYHLLLMAYASSSRTLVRWHLRPPVRTSCPDLIGAFPAAYVAQEKAANST